MQTTTADIMRFTEGERQVIRYLAQDYEAFTVNGVERHSHKEGDLTITGTCKRQGENATAFRRHLLA